MSSASQIAPQISVIVMTYNHERFIRQAIQSVLNQVDAPATEVLVAEDYSKDGTRRIVDEMVRQCPGRFTVLDRGRNLGLSGNLQDAWHRCRGKYISILEGDDTWSDSRKLAKTYVAMEAHPEWVGSFHAVQQFSELSRPIHKFLPFLYPDRPVTFQDLLQQNVIPTYSCVTYRRGIVNDFPDWHPTLVSGDWALHLLHAEHGNFGFIPEVMTHYCAHQNGMWSGMSDVNRWRQFLRFYDTLDRHYAGKYSREIEQSREAFYQNCDNTVRDLRKIEGRYYALQLHRVAAAIRWMKSTITKTGDS